jgi:ubiquinone/menaquinone biosynthesis C-methylase UbiE
VTAADDAKARAAKTYNAAADTYDDPANSFWERFGRRTIERLDLEPGTRVLDVCCGSGASALPAAQAVGPSGRVIGVDLADKLLGRARAKASPRSRRTSCTPSLQNPRSVEGFLPFPAISSHGARICLS